MWPLHDHDVSNTHCVLVPKAHNVQGQALKMLQKVLLALVWTAAAEPFHLFNPLSNNSLPGWLPIILNSRVRTAFPEANAWYNDHYIGNHLFDGPGKILIMKKTPRSQFP